MAFTKESKLQNSGVRTVRGGLASRTPSPGQPFFAIWITFPSLSGIFATPGFAIISPLKLGFVAYVTPFLYTWISAGSWVCWDGGGHEGEEKNRMRRGRLSVEFTLQD